MLFVVGVLAEEEKTVIVEVLVVAGIAAIDDVNHACVRMNIGDHHPVALVALVVVRSEGGALQVGKLPVRTPLEENVDELRGGEQEVRVLALLLSQSFLLARHITSVVGRAWVGIGFVKGEVNLLLPVDGCEIDSLLRDILASPLAGIDVHSHLGEVGCGHILKFELYCALDTVAESVVLAADVAVHRVFRRAVISNLFVSFIVPPMTSVRHDDRTGAMTAAIIIYLKNLFIFLCA